MLLPLSVSIPCGQGSGDLSPSCSVAVGPQRALCCHCKIQKCTQSYRHGWDRWAWQLSAQLASGLPSARLDDRVVVIDADVGSKKFGFMTRDQCPSRFIGFQVKIPKKEFLC